MKRENKVFLIIAIILFSIPFVALYTDGFYVFIGVLISIVPTIVFSYGFIKYEIYYRG